ncbi:hypothetical protein P4I81_19475 [Bacillus cereus]|uniref:Uncharacterized protein n=1 Tax=Bacillus cereus HuB4-4 TaxID=1053211 RepID=A0A9W5QML5_BACCE|nr:MULTISPECIES: hypothetical protein [Bacillus cereus group]EJR70906.1 hypothetical protein IK7_06396 [Bacillus cereus VD156]EOP77898.1 hypothetical protein IGM_06759 [Bacillus cereus HuB4-4]MDO6634238.1 hypothetical protein [Bacillus thuringiensis]MDO6663485.1 hypothetical protein [Bacillus thuringiensis]MDO6704237.1 hypothetical protein [Bacillus thuringiensis]
MKKTILTLMGIITVFTLTLSNINTPKENKEPSIQKIMLMSDGNTGG